MWTEWPKVALDRDQLWGGVAALFHCEFTVCRRFSTKRRSRWHFGILVLAIEILSDIMSKMPTDDVRPTSTRCVCVVWVGLWETSPDVVLILFFRHTGGPQLHKNPQKYTQNTSKPHNITPSGSHVGSLWPLQSSVAGEHYRIGLRNMEWNIFRKA